jgi:hypothetical protein
LDRVRVSAPDGLNTLWKALPKAGIETRTTLPAGIGNVRLSAG